MSAQQRRTLGGLNPVYAMLGATDLAAEKLREIGAAATGETVEATKDAKAELRRLVRGARQVPALALNEALDVVVRTRTQVDELAERGERIVKRQPRVQQTEDLIARAGETVARGQAAATRAADRTRDRANATLHTARSQADDVVEAVTHLGRTGSPSTLLRRGSVSRPVRAAESAVQSATTAASATVERAKPRRPRLSSASRAGDDTRSSRPSVAAGSGVEAGATVTTKKGASKPASDDTTATSTTAAAKSTATKSTATKSTATKSSAAKSLAGKPSSKPASKRPAAKKSASTAPEGSAAATRRAATAKKAAPRRAAKVASASAAAATSAPASAPDSSAQDSAQG